VKRFSLSRLAHRDLESIWSYIAENSGSTDVASQFLSRLYDQMSQIARSPLIGTPCERICSGGRRFPFEQYLIYYRRKDGGGIAVARVIHGMRDQNKALRHP
jgi:plasmid stabilization system protein ParE